MVELSEYSLMSHLTHNSSFRRRVFPGNRLHWYWPAKTKKWNNTCTWNTKNTCPSEEKYATRHTKPDLVTFYGIWPKNEVGLFLQPQCPCRGSLAHSCYTQKEYPYLPTYLLT